MIPPRVTTNASDYKRMINLYGRARNLAHQDVITSFAKDFNFYMSDKRKGRGVPRAKINKWPLNKTADPERGGKTKKQRIWFVKMSEKGVKKGSGGERVMGPAAVEAYNRAGSAKGAMAAGFLVSARELGLKKKGDRGLVIDRKIGKTVLQSLGKKAGAQLHAYAVNAVLGSGEVAPPIARRAWDAVVKEKTEFALKRLEKAADKLKGRRR